MVLAQHLRGSGLHMHCYARTAFGAFLRNMCIAITGSTVYSSYQTADSGTWNAGLPHKRIFMHHAQSLLVELLARSTVLNL